MLRKRSKYQGVAGYQGGEVDRHVGLGTAVRLHVDMLGTEELFGTIDGETLGNVDVLAASVVSPPRIALGVLVRHDAAGRLENCLADEVL